MAYFDFDALDEHSPEDVDEHEQFPVMPEDLYEHDQFPVMMEPTMALERTLRARAAALEESMRTMDYQVDVLRSMPLFVTDYTSPDRVYPNGALARAHIDSPTHEHMVQFLVNGTPGSFKSFAWTALWRWEDTSHYLDEIALVWTATRARKVVFNGGTQHGHWEYLDMKYLRVMMNVHGEAGEQREGLKFVVFQKVPGTTTWIGIKDVDHSWTVILSETTI